MYNLTSALVWTALILLLMAATPTVEAIVPLSFLSQPEPVFQFTDVTMPLQKKLHYLMRLYVV